MKAWIFYYADNTLIDTEEAPILLDDIDSNFQHGFCRVKKLYKNKKFAKQTGIVGATSIMVLLTTEDTLRRKTEFIEVEEN